MTRILVVEDEESFSDALSFMLRKEGFEVGIASTGTDAVAQFDQHGADLVLLDLMLPGKDGLEVCRELRGFSKVPVIMLTARGDETDRIVGLEMGADDYLTKPFDFAELEARCRAVLRRQSGAAANQKTFADTVLDSTKGEITWGDQAVALRNRELRLLEIFYNAPGQVFSKTHLMDRLFAFSDEASENAIEVYVGRLRKRLEGSGATLETVRGMGYRLVAR